MHKCCNKHAIRNLLNRLILPLEGLLCFQKLLNYFQKLLNYRHGNTELRVGFRADTIGLKQWCVGV